MVQKLLLDRTKSGFPLSVGTGLALEALFDPTEESLNEGTVEKIEDTSVYTDFVINVDTVLRNILTLFNSDEVNQLRTKDVLTVLLEELSFIESFFKTNEMSAHLYINSYKYFKDTYKEKLRKPKTPKQQKLEFITDYCLNQVPKDMNEVKLFSKDIRVEKVSRALVLTHVPADLLSYDKFSNLDLLESHTGKIKSRKTWNSKYFPIPGKDMSILPFMEHLLVTFGDSVMFTPSSIKDRVDLYEQLVTRRVNPLTTEFSASFVFGK